MRRITFLLLLSISLLCQLLAGPVDVKRAKAFASQFIEIENEAFRSVPNNAAEEAPAYYVFNGKSGKGFVIVSGEDRLPLLIGYADAGQIDQKHLPIQLQRLLNLYQKRVEVLRQTPDQGGFRTQNVFMHKPKIIVEPMIQAEWGQSEPYNNQAPKIIGEQRAVTGCVATALAQIMHYHQWPKKGKGSHTYTTRTHKKKLSVDFSKSTYKWDKMKNSYDTKWGFNDTSNRWERVPNYSTEEADAVAKLMYDVGVAVSMDFELASNGGSGAFTTRVASRMKNYFNYNAEYSMREDYAGNAFMTKIKSELDASHPFLLAGAKGYVGHAWVIDGYDENDYLHCNWGWQGMANGYYSINLMVPTRTGIGAALGEYNEAQELVIMHPNKTGTTPSEDEPATLSCMSDGYVAYKSNDAINQSQDLEVSIINAGNNGSAPVFKGYMGIGIFDSNDKLVKQKQVPWQISGLTSGVYYSTPQDLSISLQGLADGKYKVYPISKYEQEDWHPFKDANEIYIEIAGNIVRKLSDNQKIQFKLLDAPREEVQAYTTTKGCTWLNIENQSRKIIKPAKLIMTLKSKDNSKQHTLTLNDVRFFNNESLQYRAVYDMLNVQDLSAGKYDASFEIEFDGTKYPVENSFGTYEITILNADNLSELLCKKFEVYQAGESLETYHLTTDLLKKGKFKFTSTIQNEGALPFNGKLKYRLKNIADKSTIELGELTNLAIPNYEDVEEDQTAVEVEMTSLTIADGTYRIEVIAEQNGEEISVWNTELHPYYFMTKGLTDNDEESFKLTLAQAQDGGRLLFKSPIENEVFEHSFKVGTVITLTSQTKEGYKLTEVLVNGTNIYEEGKAITFTLDKDTEVNPVYTKEMIALPELTASNGTLSYDGHSAGEKLPYGTEVKLKVTPAEGYELATLTHNGNDIKASKSFTLGKTNEIAVSFTKIMIALPQLTASDGTLTYDGHSAGDELPYGTEVKLKVTPGEGYELATLTHNGNDIKASKSFTLGKTNDIAVSFSKIMIALPQLTASNGTLSYDGHSAGEKLPYGTEVKLKATPAEGYELVVLMHNGADIMANKTFILVEGNKIEVKFAKTTAIITAERSVQVFPNPATDYVELKGFSANEEVYLLTMTGKVVLSIQLNSDGSSRINVSNLPRGLYLLRSKTSVTKLQLQ